MTDKPSRGLPLFAAILLLSLPLFYVGSYAALVETDGRLHMNDDGICRPRDYRYGGKVAEVFYWPLRLVDRQLRALPD